MDTRDLFERLGLALAIGLLIGLERGWRERDFGDGERAAGIRTFPDRLTRRAVGRDGGPPLGANFPSAGEATGGPVNIRRDCSCSVVTSDLPAPWALLRAPEFGYDPVPIAAIKHLIRTCIAPDGARTIRD
jgi:hypothetical protein